MSIDTKISDEQLVSYIDNELDELETAKIEEKLCDNPKLKIKADGYKKSQIILKNGFSVDKLKTPDHILARLDILERADAKPKQTKRVSFFLENIYSYIQLQYFIPTTAAFALGILLAPFFLPTSGGISMQGGDVSERQLSTRGSNVASIANEISIIPSMSDYLNARIIQYGSGIPNGGLIQAGIPFSVSLLSPLNGTATISEIAQDMSAELLDTTDIAVGKYLTFTAMQVDDQSSLTLSIELKNNEIQVTQRLEFSVKN